MHKLVTTLAVAAVAPAAMMLGGCAGSTKGDHSHTARKISKSKVEAAQREWGQGIVDISSVHASNGDYKARATKHINDLYAYAIFFNEFP